MRSDAPGERESPVSRSSASGTSELRRLREALDERIEFIEDMSHELRGGLTFVRGYVDLFLAGTLGPLDERQEHALRVIERRTAAIIRLLDQMLSLERARAGHLELCADVDLSELVHHTVQAASVVAAQSGVSLKVDAPTTCFMREADCRRLQQALDNVIGNAIKFSETGDEVLVKLMETPDRALLSVQDQGIGMTADELEHVFERFYRGSRASQKIGGSGLGLVISRAIVEAHGGRIWAESVPGDGATFHIDLPKAGPADNGRAGD